MAVHSRPCSPERQAFHSIGVRSHPQPSTGNGSQLGSHCLGPRADDYGACAPETQH
jgi:hypothetical protein